MSKAIKGPRQIKFYMYALSICWTLIVVASLIWNLSHMHISSNSQTVFVLVHAVLWFSGLAVITMGGWKQLQANERIRMYSEDLINELCERKISESFIHSIFESIEVGFVVVDRQYNVQYANKAYCKTYGEQVEDVIGKHCYTVSHHIERPCYEEGEECAVKMAFETGKSHNVTHTHYDKYKTPIYIDINAYPIMDEVGDVVSVIEMTNDITEQQGRELKSRHSKRSDTVRQLAGGMAHGFNNILSVIINYANLMLMKTTEEGQQHNLQQILNATDKAVILTTKLLAFSGKQSIDPKPADLNEIIRNSQKNMAKVIGDNIEVKMLLTEARLTILADKEQMEQALLHIIENAQDAMPDGGKLLIETKGTNIDDAFIKLHGFGEPGRYAILSVSDTGAGMDKATIKSIFEPFFSTKGTSEGGLTLAMVYGIIEQHNGYINVYSEPDKGTSFKIYIPLIKGKAEETLDEKPAEAIVVGGKETLLLAENDDAVREVTRFLLEEFGYTVIEAIDGEDTLAKFRENKDAIKMMILDVVMPGMSGKDAYMEIVREKPEVKTIFQSGYSLDFLKDKDMYVEGIEYIMKPIPPTELRLKIREMLDN